MSAPSHFAMLSACGPPQSRPGATYERGGETGGWETAAWATVKLAETEGFEPSIRL
jgi:hypothetical protein